MRALFLWNRTVARYQPREIAVKRQQGVGEVGAELELPIIHGQPPIPFVPAFVLPVHSSSGAGTQVLGFVYTD